MPGDAESVDKSADGLEYTFHLRDDAKWYDENGEGIRSHHPDKNKEKRRKQIIGLLEKVGLSKTHMSRYPHEFSGGQLHELELQGHLLLILNLLLLMNQSQHLMFQFKYKL